MKYWVLMGGEVDVWGELWGIAAGLGDKQTYEVTGTERKAKNWSS